MFLLHTEKRPIETSVILWQRPRKPYKVLAPPSMKIPGDGGSKVKLPSVGWGMDVSGTSQRKQKQVH